MGHPRTRRRSVKVQVLLLSICLHFARDLRVFVVHVYFVMLNNENLDRTHSLVVWRILDGKAEHEAQTQGLVDG